MSIDTKSLFLENIRLKLKAKNLNINSYDFNRPWGGFFVISETDTKLFVALFFPEQASEILHLPFPLSPKILCVAPHQRLSWQYHNRRRELWKLIEGQAAYIKSDDNEEKELQMMETGELLSLNSAERHRLIGLNEWGVIAEIWQHTNQGFPSDEDDIVRLQDDYGR